MAVTRDERHRYGQHYTPPLVAKLLAAFAVRSASDLVFDPSCGDGRLLAEGLELKVDLSANANRASRAYEVYGVDRSTSAIELATRTKARVAVADFFDVDPGRTINDRLTLPKAFDAIIGNPPYIRQEMMGARDKRRIERRLSLDRASLPDAHWPKWSGRSDIYVYFFARTIRFLKEGGRLVFLTASSWLDVGYGVALREFLLNNFRIVAIIESSAESFFADASINTSITVLEREPDARVRSDNPVKFVQLHRPLSVIVESGFSRSRKKHVERVRTVANEIEREGRSVTTDVYRIRIVEHGRLMASSTWETPCRGGPPWPPLARQGDRTPRTGHEGLPLARQGGRIPRRRSHGGPPLDAFVPCGGWGKYLRADDVFFHILEKGSSRMRQLSDLARVRFGVKTGANEFFYVTENGERAKSIAQRAKAEAGLRALRSIASVRRGLTTGANEFFYLTRPPTQPPTPNPQSLIPVHDASGETRVIESRFLSPVVFSLKEIAGIALEQVDNGKLFFNCAATLDELAGTNALDYIRSGERAGYDQRPSCASRERWYSVANGRKPAPLLFPSKVGERWLVALNRAHVFEDKKLYGIFPAEDVSELVLAALLNSTWARYYAEITCRQMTGAQAIADIDVVVAEQVMIPDPRDLSRAMKKKLEGALMMLTHRPVYSIFEETKRADRRKLDCLTLEAIGFDGPSRNVVLEQLYEAAADLVRARLSRVS